MKLIKKIRGYFEVQTYPELAAAGQRQYQRDGEVLRAPVAPDLLWR